MESLQDDQFQLIRFVEAQNPVYDQVKSELLHGSKSSHWMWFIFPQIRGLGRSSLSQKFSISSLEEASAYFMHPVLGPRLHDCSELAFNVENRTAIQIFGAIDEMKFHSSMTLFSRVATEDSIFHKVLAKYFGGDLDSSTMSLL